MGFQLNLLGFSTFLLSALILCHSHKVTLNVAGTLNCRDCIKQQLSTAGQEHPGLHVTVHCDFQSRETKTHGTSSVDKKGNFNLTLSAEITQDNNSKHRCYATLQSALTTQCPIHKAPTASMKNLTFHHVATQTLHNIHYPIVFSPVTCQSAFFWPFFKFPPTPVFVLPSPLPPITYTPPVEVPFPPSPLPSKTPNSPLIPPALPPPGTEYGNPFSPPTPAARIPLSPPTPPPSGQECGNIFPPQQAPMPSPKFQKPIPPPFSNPPPYVPTPSPPFSASATPPIFPMPNEKLSPPPSPTGILLTPPTHYRKPNPIPRPPPVPLLPPTTTSKLKPRPRS